MKFYTKDKKVRPITKRKVSLHTMQTGVAHLSVPKRNRILEKKMLNRVQTTDMKTLQNNPNPKQYLIIPSGPSKTGEDWRAGMMEATSLEGAKRNIEILKSKGYCGGKILAPKDKQEGHKIGWVVIGKFGREWKDPNAWNGKYNIDKSLINDWLRLENTSKTKATLKFMHPSTFLKQCPTPEIFKGEQKYKNADECPSQVGYNEQLVRAYQRQIYSNTQIVPPHLDKRKGTFKKWVGHDGRHRAKAAYLSGLKRIPVVILEDR